MKRLFWLLLFLAAPAFANESARGFCEVGNRTVTLSGLTSVTKVQQSFPQCAVTVYNSGTVTAATIYSDNANPPTAIPGGSFTANANGSWQFYAANGSYDVVLSGAGFPTPFTLTAVIVGSNGPVNCQVMPGANFGVKFTNAVANLPSTGGIVDCSGLQGAQSVASDVFTGVAKPIRLLWPSGTVSSAVSLTIPITTEIDDQQCGLLSMANGTTATISTTPIAPRCQIFTGSGNIAGLPEAKPEWFGAVLNASGTDSGPGILKASQAILSGGVAGKVSFAFGTYYVASEIKFTQAIVGIKWAAEGNTRLIWNGATDTSKALVRASLSSGVTFSGNVFEGVWLNANFKAGYAFLEETIDANTPNGSGNRWSNSYFEGATVANVLIGAIVEPYVYDCNCSGWLFDNDTFANGLYNVKINSPDAMDNRFFRSNFTVNVSNKTLQHARIVFGVNTVFDQTQFNQIDNYTATATSIYALTPVVVHDVYMEESRLAIVVDGSHTYAPKYVFENIQSVDSRTTASLSALPFIQSNVNTVVKNVSLNITAMSGTRTLTLTGANNAVENVDIGAGLIDGQIPSGTKIYGNVTLQATGATVGLGGEPTANSFARLKFTPSTTQTNWQISANDIAAGQLEGTPSTVAGGTAFTTPSFSYNGSTYSVKGAITTINIGGTPASNASGYLQFTKSNSQVNWQVSSNNAHAGALEFTPSTAGGGTTFTTPQLWLSPLGTLVINSATTVGVGVDLSLAGKFYSAGMTSSATGTYLCLNTSTNEVTQNGTMCTLSSARYKHDFKRDVSGLKSVMAMRPISFVRNDHPELGRQVGFLAEDMAKVESRLVVKDEQGRPNQVLYENMTAVLARAIQEMQAEIDELKRKLR